MAEEIVVEDVDLVSEVPVPDVVDDGLPDRVKVALAKERLAAKESERRARDAEARIKEFEDRDKSDAQKLQERADALTVENTALRIENLRRDVAAENDLTPAQARRLVGSTREELEADVIAIAEAFPPVKPAYQDIAQGARQGGAAPVYRRSQLNDHAFYLANKADILAAVAEGGSRITD